MDDAENPSKLMQLLDKTCKYEGDDAKSDRSYSIKNLRIFAMIWCDGDVKEKVVEFYDMLQDNDQPSIAASDKDFNKNFYPILDWAYLNVMKYEHLVTGSEPNTLNDEKIEELKEKYEELAETFLDEVFGYESTLDRKDWQNLTVKKMDFIFYPNKIREKLEIENYNLI